MSLLARLPDSIAIHLVPLDAKGLEVEDAFFEAKNALSKQQVDWKDYELKKRRFSGLLEDYKGRFKLYFQEKLEECGQKEKLALGYFNSE